MLYGLFAFEDYRGIACGLVVKKCDEKGEKNMEKGEKERGEKGGNEVLALITSNRDATRDFIKMSA